MATSFEQSTATATDRIQSMFGDTNARAKSAMEKSAKLAEDVAELTKGNMEALVASGRVAAKAAETLTQDAAEFGKKNFEAAATTMKNMASVKSPTELLQIQSEFARSSFDAMVAEVSKFSENYMKLVGEVVQPLSSRYAVAVDKIKGSAL